MNRGSTQSDATRALLSRLWQRGIPLLMERLAILEQAAAAAHTGTLTADLRDQALDITHKLSGSLGMFGYPDGTQLTRELELLLEAPTAPPPDRFTEITAELRAILFPPS
jgi:HPt (histidine-containing phosphotransfer) domain-containing protein